MHGRGDPRSITAVSEAAGVILSRCIGQAAGRGVRVQLASSRAGPDTRQYTREQPSSTILGNA
jgi:hypothetical protein